MASTTPAERDRAAVPGVGVLQGVGARLLRRLGVDEADELLDRLGAVTFDTPTDTMMSTAKAAEAATNAAP